MMKSAILTLIFIVVLSGTIWVTSMIIANILENYKYYVGVPPFGTWVYPLAWLAPLVRVTGEILAVASGAIVVSIKALKSALR